MNFLIIRLSSLGDVILTQPLVAELRDLYPGCGISYVCKPEYASLVGMMADDISVLPWSETAGFFKELRKLRFDAVFDLHGKLASTLILLSAKARRRIRYDKQRSLRQAIVAHKTSASISSTVELYYSALRKLTGKPFSSIRFPILDLPRADLHPDNLPLKSPQDKLIALFPGAAHPTKMYPERQWREFFSLAPGNWRFILLGSPKEASITERLRSANPKRIENRCGGYTFPELASLIDSCDLVISPDSGPMHLAAALRAPQIAIFGSTHPRLGFGPLNPYARVLCADLDCQPCTLHGQISCPLGHFDCMRRISPKLLFDSALEIINEV